MELGKNLTLRYTFLQCGYWMLYCAIYSYAAVYLYAKGLTDQEVGVVLALSNILAVICQPAIASFADKTKRLSLGGIVSILAAVGILFVAVLVFSPALLVVTAVLFILVCTVMITIQPLMNAMAMEAENNGFVVNFGVARGIGSAAYALASMAFGKLAAMHGPEILPLFYGIFLLGIGLFAFFFPKGKKQDPVAEVALELPEPEEAGGFVRRYPRFMLFLVGLALVYICINMVESYLIRLVENVGGDSGDFGMILSLKAIVEIPVMFGFSFLVKRIGIRKLLRFCVLCFTIKAVLLWQAKTVFMLYFAQIFQMLSYGIFVPAFVYYVNRVMKTRDKIKGQAGVTAAMTIGGIFGSLLGGGLLERMGINFMLPVAVSISAAGAAIMFFGVEAVEEP